MKRVFHAIAFVTTILVLSQTSAHAQAARTFVASNGNDNQACSRAQPCRTFAGAIAKTAAGGVINCVDAADYAAVTIAKSIAIVCDNTTAGISSNAVAVTVSIATTDTVTLSGLDLEGNGVGTAGVSLANGGTLELRKVRISGFRGGGSNRAFGVNFAPTAAAKLHVSDSTITDNGFGFGGAGIGFVTSGPTISAEITNSNIDNNLLGMRVFGAANICSVTVTNSSLSGNGAGINTGGSNVMLQNVTIANNSQVGISNTNPGGTVRVGNSTVSGNGIGVNTVFGAFTTSYKNNQIRGNTTDGTPLAAETAE